VEPSASAFADHWKAHRYCPAAQLKDEEACLSRPKRRQWARERCHQLLKAPNSAFRRCHSEVRRVFQAKVKGLRKIFQVSPDAFLLRCERDACSCDSGGDCACVCAAAAAYAEKCAEAGAPVEWRSQRDCRMGEIMLQLII